MGRRYYCDYCEKSFIDDIDARKKHLQSSNHIKNRNIHYENARDPETILREELLKIPCRRYAQNGSCPFEGSCKYTHYSPEELCELRQLVEQIQTERRKKQEEMPGVPSVESWLDKLSDKTIGKSEETIRIFWNYPEHLASRLDLPPSLIKMRPEHFFDDNFEEWGK